MKTKRVQLKPGEIIQRLDEIAQPEAFGFKEHSVYELVVEGSRPSRLGTPVVEGESVFRNVIVEYTPGETRQYRAAVPGKRSEQQWTSNLAAAQVWASGSVKWDGCSNLRFDEQDVVALHGCRKRDLTDIGVRLGRVWELAKRKIPRWDNTVAEE